MLREQGKEPVLYVIGRKGVNYYRFRKREVAASWTGFSEQPTLRGRGRGGAGAGGRVHGRGRRAGHRGGGRDRGRSGRGRRAVDELHLVYTQFKNMVTQIAAGPADGADGGRVRRDGLDGSARPTGVGDPAALRVRAGRRTRCSTRCCRKYISARLFAALLESAASESANRQRAMKAATDNANEFIRNLTRESNQARQAQITQEISEIVGGADALVSAGSES